MASFSYSSSSSIVPEIRVIEQCRVCPSFDGLPAALGAVSLPFTFFDIFWLGNNPVERLFFYRWPDLTTPHFVASALPRLKRSLSLALRHYYPLAGRLRSPKPGSSSTDKFHIYCTVGDAVSFTLAECDGDHCFDQLAGDHPRRVETFRPLVPEIPTAADGDGSLPLMALQVTVFPGVGVCVAVSIRHEACDGSGFTSFVKAWASTCNSSDEDAISRPAGGLPVIDRTLVPDPRGLYTLFYDTMMSLRGVEMPRVEGPVVVHSTFLLKRAHIEELRRQALEQRPPPDLRYSSFVLTSAYVWVCLLKAREQAPPPQDVGDASYLFFAVDSRSRLSPPLPAAYFGNCLGVCFVDARRSDLLGEGGVGRAAEAIAESVARLGKDGEVLRDAEEWIPKALARLPGRPLSIAGSPRFRVYDADFGWGRPAKVDLLGIEKTGAMALVDSRDADGGVEVGLVLRAAEMAKFSSLFAAGLEDPGNGVGR